MSKHVKKLKESEGPPEGGYEVWEPFDTETNEESYRRVDDMRGGVAESTEEVTYIYWRRRLETLGSEQELDDTASM